MGEATGSGNALFWLRRGEHTFVLRRPPQVVNAPGASDMTREWRILVALESTPVPHPRPLLLCEDAGVIGAPFLIMEKVDGFTPVGRLPAPYDRPKSRRELSMAMVDALAELAAVDWRARGLEGLGKPEGFLERQVGRWLVQFDRYRTREIPELDFVARWLDGNRPAMSAPAIMHGDFSPYNVIAAPHDTQRLAAVIDWDTGTIGDLFTFPCPGLRIKAPKCPEISFDSPPRQLYYDYAERNIGRPTLLRRSHATPPPRRPDPARRHRARAGPRSQGTGQPPAPAAHW